MSRAAEVIYKDLLVAGRNPRPASEIAKSCGFLTPQTVAHLKELAQLDLAREVDGEWVRV